MMEHCWKIEIICIILQNPSEINVPKINHTYMNFHYHSMMLIELVCPYQQNECSWITLEVSFLEVNPTNSPMVLTTTNRLFFQEKSKLIKVGFKIGFVFL